MRTVRMRGDAVAGITMMMVGAARGLVESVQYMAARRRRDVTRFAANNFLGSTRRQN